MCPTSASRPGPSSHRLTFHIFHDGRAAVVSDRDRLVVERRITPEVSHSSRGDTEGLGTVHSSETDQGQQVLVL